MSCGLHTGCGWTPEKGCPVAVSVHRVIATEPRAVSPFSNAEREELTRGGKAANPDTAPRSGDGSRRQAHNVKGGRARLPVYKGVPTAKRARPW